jgi:serine/threonine protein kinase
VEISVPCVPLRIPTLKGIGQPALLARWGDVARLDQFELVRRLGGGGMAEVFLARERAGGRSVVIKRLRPNLIQTKNFLGMFLDEIQVTARLDHPHLVKLAEPGYSLTEWFLVLEPIAGMPLSRLLRRLSELTHGSTPLSSGAVALLGGQIASGLHHAHTMQDEGGNPMNVVHRDVSPENIMVTFAGQAKLIDFGVVKLTGCAGHTRPGDVKGKFGYMAPEQVRTSGAITPRTDVFALGVVLWEMLAGKRLFLRKSPVDSLRALLEERVPHPSEVRPIGPFLDGIVMRALCPDPNQRFADAGQMADALFGIVGRHRKSVEVELVEKVGLARHQGAKGHAGMTTGAKGAEKGTETDLEPGSTRSGSTTVRRRPPTADIRTAPRSGPSAASPRPTLPLPRRRANRTVLRAFPRDLPRRFWRSLSRPFVTLGLAMLLVLDVGLRILGLASPAPMVRSNTVSGVVPVTAPGAVSGRSASAASPPMRMPIIELLPLRLRTLMPANDVAAPAAETSRVATARQAVHRPGIAPTGRLRRRLINQAHPPRAVRSRSAPAAVRAPPSSFRRNRSLR